MLSEDTRGKGKLLTGKIVSDKMDKTIVVSVSRTVKHPQYKKYVRRAKKYKAHDERNEGRVGDTVVIRESRPLSAEKRWRLVTIKDRAVG